MPWGAGSIHHGREAESGMVVHGIDLATGDLHPGIRLSLLGELFSYQKINPISLQPEHLTSTYPLIRLPCPATSTGAFAAFEAVGASLTGNCSRAALSSSALTSAPIRIAALLK